MSWVCFGENLMCYNARPQLQVCLIHKRHRWVWHTTAVTSMGTREPPWSQWESLANPRFEIVERRNRSVELVCRKRLSWSHFKQRYTEGEIQRKDNDQQLVSPHKTVCKRSLHHIIKHIYRFVCIVQEWRCLFQISEYGTAF